MAEITQQEMRQLEAAQAGLDSFSDGGPPVTAQVAALETGEPIFGAAGSGPAQHILVDHYFTSSLRLLWVYSSGWRHVNITNTEEQGLVQVAYASDRVDVWWDAGNKLTLMRCWKTF